MNLKKLLLFLFTSAFCIGCNSVEKQDQELAYFTSLIEGKFSSRKQAENEEGFASVYLINLPIWKDKPGYWFYHELGNEKDSSVIFNQRIIQIKRSDSSTIRSISYTFLSPGKYERAWKNIALFDQLHQDSLQLKKGCDLFYKQKTATIFQGKTKKGTCKSSFRENISYTTSNVVVSKDKISSWIKGFDRDHKQVWGKIQGPYKYDRVQKNW